MHGTVTVWIHVPDTVDWILESFPCFNMGSESGSSMGLKNLILCFKSNLIIHH